MSFIGFFDTAKSNIEVALTKIGEDMVINPRAYTDVVLRDRRAGDSSNNFNEQSPPSPASILLEYFDVFDNPEGNNLDNRVRREDLDDLALGTYDEDIVRQRLIAMGITDEDDIQNAIAEIRAAAQELLHNRVMLDELDGARNGKVDDKVSSEDVMIWINEEKRQQIAKDVNGRIEALERLERPLMNRIIQSLIDDLGRRIDDLNQLAFNTPEGAIARYEELNAVRMELEAFYEYTRNRPDNFNHSQWTSSHNSYERGNYSLTQQYEEFGIRSFELDINSDSLDGDDHVGDWPVYHDSGDDKEVQLSTYLNEIASIDSSEPLTIFIDFKNKPLSDEGQSPTDLDQLLQDRLGDRLFTPEDLMALRPGTTTLQEAITLGGWPTTEELDGKVLVILTSGNNPIVRGDGDKLLDRYYDYDRTSGVGMNAFIAPEPNVDVVFDDDGWQHRLDAENNAVFYNMGEVDLLRLFTKGSLNPTIINTISEQGSMVRVYGVQSADSFDSVQGAGANFIGTDHIDKEGFTPN